MNEVNYVASKQTEAKAIMLRIFGKIILYKKKLSQLSPYLLIIQDFLKKKNYVVI